MSTQDRTMSPRIHTKLGDDGSTGLLFGGRVSKADALVDTLGSLDETVAALGMARAATTDQELAAIILRTQRGLFVAAADLAANPHARDQLVPAISLVTADMVAGYVLTAALPEQTRSRSATPRRANPAADTSDTRTPADPRVRAWRSACHTRDMGCRLDDRRTPRHRAGRVAVLAR